MATVKLLDPDFCRECPFHSVATRKTPAGVTVHINQCWRRDCDNTVNEEPQLPGLDDVLSGPRGEV